MIITIDGPSWTGKSTVAKALAKQTGFTFINTGAMFRAVAWKAHNHNIDPSNKEEIISLTKNTSFQFDTRNQEFRTIVDSEDVTEELSAPEIVPLCSPIAKIPEVREILLNVQRDLAKEGDYIIEGRDTGSVVFPNADLKFYIDANMDIRVTRFFKLLPDEKKSEYTREQVREIIEKIDIEDRNREIAPLTIPKNAIIYNNSKSPTAEQDAIVLWYYLHHKDEIVSNSQTLSQK